jgi:hypothetical protein
MADEVFRLYKVLSEFGACAGEVSVTIYNVRGKATVVNFPHAPHASEKRRAARVNGAMKICRGCDLLELCKKFAALKPPMDEGTVLAEIYYGDRAMLMRQVMDHNSKFAKRSMKISGHRSWTCKDPAPDDLSADEFYKVYVQEIYLRPWANDGWQERRDDHVDPNLHLTYDNVPDDWDDHPMEFYKDEIIKKKISKPDHTHHAGCGCKLKG